MKSDFPLLSKSKIVYLDSAATSQKPSSVINAVAEHYEQSNANTHRGLYALSQKATDHFEAARSKVARFINAEPQEIVFTRSATESINMLSYSLAPFLSGKGVLLTEMEHHANLVPWQQLCARTGTKLSFVGLRGFELDYEDAAKKIAGQAIFAFTDTSNVLGTVNDTRKLCGLAASNGALSVVDAAQGAAHHKIDVKDLDCDFLVMSSHKMLGPSGVGILYINKKHLEKLEPYNFGGDMISEVSFESARWAEAPAKFEAGTQNIEGVVGLGAAIDYLEKFGMDRVERIEHDLLTLAKAELSKNPRVKFYSPQSSVCGILSFNIDGVHPHDVASILDSFGVCVRAGHHCAMPLMKKLGLQGTVRASFYLYNTEQDIMVLSKAVGEVIQVFK